MALRLSETNRKKFFQILALDAFAAVTALYYQFKTVKAGKIVIRNSTPKKVAWSFVGVMALITLGFVVVAREKDDDDKDIIRGLPPEDR